VKILVCFAGADAAIPQSSVPLRPPPATRLLAQPFGAGTDVIGFTAYSNMTGKSKFMSYRAYNQSCPSALDRSHHGHGLIPVTM